MPHSDLTADVLLDARAELGEGPTWDAAAESLLWVDITAGSVHRTHPGTGADTAFDAGGRLGFAVPTASGRLLLGLDTALTLTGPQGGDPRPVLPGSALGTGPGAGRHVNDGRCDPSGRLWFGTSSAPVARGAALHRWTPTTGLATVAREVTVSNGLDWSPDGRSLYYADSRAGGVDVFDVHPDTGEVSGRRRLADIDPGVPDGLSVDAEGRVWVAVWDGWQVRCLTPDGATDAVVHLPVQRPTSVAFGPAGTLFVTSARHGLDADGLADQRWAGAVFAVPVGVPGRGYTPFDDGALLGPTAG